MFTQYSRPSSPEAIAALWTGQPRPATKQPNALKTKRTKPTFGKRKPRH
jgi:hypothetical protein